MNILVTEIVRITRGKNCTLYLLSGDKKDFVLGTLNYSKENDFMANAFGANDTLKLGKKAYIEVNDKDEIISIANKDCEVCVANFIVDDIKGTYKYSDSKEFILNKYGVSVEEYMSMVKYEIKNNYTLRLID